MKNIKTLAIVSGAAGAVGKAFLDAFAVQGCDCIGISRRPIEADHKIVISDLSDADQTNKVINTIDFRDYEKIIFVHTVGGFKFEVDGKPEIDEDCDGIDDEVYHGNVDTFKNVVDALITRVVCWQELAIANIGSISDQFDICWWRSYSRAKEAVRVMMRGLVKEESVRCVSLNVSTVKTDKECDLRPFADMKYWLTAEELAEKAMPYLICPATGYIEVSLFNPMPNFNPVQYYLDPVAIRERWMREMGKK